MIKDEFKVNLFDISLSITKEKLFKILQVKDFLDQI